MKKRVFSRKGATTLHVIVAVILIASGVLFLINKSALGVILASVGLLIEAVKNWVK